MNHKICIELLIHDLNIKLNKVLCYTHRLYISLAFELLFTIIIINNNNIK